MTDIFGRLAAALAVLVLWAGGPAVAQENLDQDKTAAQLYASDCAICHKSPQALVKGLRFAGLDGFLRQHYTASRESAAAISAYLKTLDRGGPAAKNEGASKRKANAALPQRRPAKPKPSDDKASESNSPESNSSESKSLESKASESKASESKSSGGKPAEPDANAAAPEHAQAKSTPKSSEGNSPEGKASEGKPAEPKPARSEPAPPQATPAEPVPEAKPDKSD